MTVECPCTLQWDAHSPQKFSSSHGGSGLPIHGSLGPPSHQPKRHLDWFSHFCMAHSLVWQTDHAIRLVTMHCIYVYSPEMQPNNNINNNNNKLAFYSKDARCSCKVSMPYCFMTVYQPMTALTKMFMTIFVFPLIFKLPWNYFLPRVK